jgi:restriction system protein
MVIIGIIEDVPAGLIILQMIPAAIPNPKQVIAQLPQKQLTCEQCGNQKVLRKGPRGEFYGCSGYPKCRNTKAE